MQLNRNSGIVRYWTRVAWWKSDAEKTKQLAEGTNICAFMEQIVIGTVTKVAFWMFMGGVGIPFLWTVSAGIAVIVAACWGKIPIGWDEQFRNDPARWWFPANCWAWGDRLHFTVRGRKLYPWHALAPIAIAVAGYALTELCTTLFGPVSAQFAAEHPALLAFLWIMATFMGVGVLLAMMGLAVAAVREFCGAVRSSDAWRFSRAWLAAKKDRVCPKIEFVGIRRVDQ